MALEPPPLQSDEAAIFEIRSRCGEDTQITNMSARSGPEARLLVELAHSEAHASGEPLYEVESVGLLREADRPVDTPRPVLDWLRAQVGLSKN